MRHIPAAMFYQYTNQVMSHGGAIHLTQLYKKNNVDKNRTFSPDEDESTLIERREETVKSPWFSLNHISHLTIVEKQLAQYWFSLET